MKDSINGFMNAEGFNEIAGNLHMLTEALMCGETALRLKQDGKVISKWRINITPHSDPSAYCPAYKAAWAQDKLVFSGVDQITTLRRRLNMGVVKAEKRRQQALFPIPKLAKGI